MKIVRNKKLAVEIAGSGEPVILIHGLGGTTNVCGAQLPALAHKFKVIRRYDLEGSGRSPASSSLSLASWVDDLEALMMAKCAAKARIVAHSLGTLIAQHFAAEHPQRVDRLALLGVNRAPSDDRRQALRDRVQKLSGGTRAITQLSKCSRANSCCDSRRRATRVRARPWPRHSPPTLRASLVLCSQVRTIP